MASAWSLRRRLIALLVLATGLAWTAIAVATYVDAHEHADELFDAQLAEFAEVLRSIVRHEAHEMGSPDLGLDPEYSHIKALTYQVFSVTGQLLMRSVATPRAALANVPGYSDVEVGGERWRAFLKVDEMNGTVLIVAHREEIREALARSMALQLVVPILLGLPLLGLAMWFAVSRGVAPLERLATQVGNRESGNLAPMDAGGAPNEVRPLVEALNQLFDRLARSFENERRFTGDAAHELRTPLAALKTQAEVALTTASDDKRRHALAQVVAGVDRGTRLLDQLLALARLDAARAGASEIVDLSAAAREAVADLAPAALERDVRVEAPGPSAEPVRTRGEPTMLHALIRNLVENAIRYTPPGARVRVCVSREGDRARLAVEDAGPGVPPEYRSRMFDRFFRLPGDSSRGSGLGLSIARRVAELHGGEIAAAQSADLRGLAVIVALPALGSGRNSGES